VYCVMINGSGLHRFFQEKLRIRAARERTTGFSSKRFFGLCVSGHLGATFPRLSGTGTRSFSAFADGSRLACSIGSSRPCRTRRTSSTEADFEYVIVDGTIVRVHQHGTGAKGGTRSQAIGRSRGGLTTKIVALVDALGNLVRFVLLPGQRHDSVGVAPLLTDLDFAALLADKAFDSDGFRTELDNRGAVAVIPPKANRVTTIPCDFEMYKWRHLVENFFCKIKEFRRIATRYDKTDESFSAMIQLVGSVLATR